jgi:hypothetical protein
MKGSLLIGIALILLGIATLVYGHFHYRTRETVVKIGPIEATAETTKTVPLPPILGWGLLGAGACVLFTSARSKP